MIIASVGTKLQVIDMNGKVKTEIEINFKPAFIRQTGRSSSATSKSMPF